MVGRASLPAGRPAWAREGAPACPDAAMICNNLHAERGGGPAFTPARLHPRVCAVRRARVTAAPLRPRRRRCQRARAQAEGGGRLLGAGAGRSCCARGPRAAPPPPPPAPRPPAGWPGGRRQHPSSHGGGAVEGVERRQAPAGGVPVAHAGGGGRAAAHRARCGARTRGGPVQVVRGVGAQRLRRSLCAPRLASLAARVLCRGVTHGRVGALAARHSPANRGRPAPLLPGGSSCEALMTTCRAASNSTLTCSTWPGRTGR